MTADPLAALGDALDPLPPDGKKDVPPPDDPMAVARAFLKERYRRGDDLLLRHHRGSFYRWEGTCWPEDEERRVKSELYHWLEPTVYYAGPKTGWVAFRPNAKKVSEVAQAAAAIGHVPEALDRPCWLDSREAGDLLALSNGLLDLTARTVHPHEPAFFNEHALPFAFDPDAQPPERWLGFLRELWGDDTDSVECLQEAMGYVLSGETRQQKMFLLVGPPRSGKGTIGRVLTGLLGAHNVAAPTLAGLTQNFGLQGLIGKPLALISDARLSNKADGTIAVERLLSISGEDTLTIDRKYKDHWTGRLPSRFLILTNELPRFSDASGALASRFVILVLSETFLGREDPLLSDKLLEEAPSIFNWCLKGLDRLRARGYFQEPPASLDALRHMGDLASPVSAFVRDECVLGSEYEVSKDDLWATWKAWCESEGMRPGTKALLMRDLRAAHPEVQSKRPRDGKQRRYVAAGIAMRSAVGPLPDHTDHIGREAPRETPDHPDLSGDGAGWSGWSGRSPTVVRAKQTGPDLTDDEVRAVVARHPDVFPPGTPWEQICEHAPIVLRQEQRLAAAEEGADA